MKDEVVERLCKEYKVSREMLLGKSQVKKALKARRELIRELRYTCHMKISEIRRFTNRSLSNIYSALAENKDKEGKPMYIRKPANTQVQIPVVSVTDLDNLIKEMNL